MLNQVVLTGNLGADPEVFYSSEGNVVVSFDLAFRVSKKKTGWIRIKCFSRLAEVVQQYLHKGARIAIIGTLWLLQNYRKRRRVEQAQKKEEATSDKPH